METEVVKLFAQFGFPALIAGVLIVWMTRSLNGKLDRLGGAVDGLKDATTQHTFALRENTGKLDTLLRKLE